MSFDLQAKVWNIDFIKPASHKYVLLCLAHRANKAGVCWPSIATISKDTGLSLGTVRSAIKTLDADNWISLDRRSGQSTRFMLNVQHIEEWGVNTPTNFDRGTHTRIDRGTPDKTATPPLPELVDDPSQNCKPNKERTNQEQVTKQMVYERDGAGAFMAELAEIPEDWEPSDKVREWAAAQGIGEEDFKAHAEAFKRKCRKRRYKYYCFDAGLEDAIIQNWANITPDQSQFMRAGVYVAGRNA
tara:strand:+ start:194 stop:922 length:729 start_codon:yes stop_codon:yes gene_type:complete